MALGSRQDRTPPLAQGEGMRVVGIDPGTWRMGYGVIEGRPPFDQDNARAVRWGVLSVGASLSLAQRLLKLYQGVCEVLEKDRPEAMALEEPFVGRERSPRSAIAIGRAQAVAMMAAARFDIPVFTYSPGVVKESVTGYGAGSKEQVQEMVRLQLGLEEAPPHDAADALAVALCHLSQIRMMGLTEA